MTPRRSCATFVLVLVLPGCFVAGNPTPMTRFVPSTLPYVLLDGSQIAANGQDLTDNMLLHPINMTEAGASLPMARGCDAETAVSSATKSNAGTAGTDYQCANWSLPLANGRSGDSSSATGTWSNNCNINCKTTLRFYCFEQGT